MAATTQEKYHFIYQDDYGQEYQISLTKDVLDNNYPDSLFKLLVTHKHMCVTKHIGEKTYYVLDKPLTMASRIAEFMERPFTFTLPDVNCYLEALKNEASYLGVHQLVKWVSLAIGII